jgi:hypothetical protein
MKDSVEITIDLRINGYEVDTIFKYEDGKWSRKAVVLDGQVLRIDVDVELRPLGNAHSRVEEAGS